MKVTIKPRTATPDPRPVPVPARALRPGDRFRPAFGHYPVSRYLGDLYIRTTAELGTKGSGFHVGESLLAFVDADLPVILCDSNGNPIIPDVPAPNVTTLGELEVGDVYCSVAFPDRYWMKLGARDDGFDVLRVYSSRPIGLGRIGWDGPHVLVIKVDAEIIIEESTAVSENED